MQPYEWWYVAYLCSWVLLFLDSSESLGVAKEWWYGIKLLPHENAIKKGLSRLVA